MPCDLIFVSVQLKDDHAFAQDPACRITDCAATWRLYCTGVLDVAGGRGSLSFALQSLHGISCTVVDPRPPKPTKQQLRFLRQPRKLLFSDTVASDAADISQKVGRSTASPADSVAGEAERELGQASEGAPATRADATEDSAGPARFLASLADAADDAPGPVAAPDEALAVQAGAAEHAAEPTELSVGAQAGQGLSEHIQAAFNEELWSGQHAESLNEASLIIGLHPDQVRCLPFIMQLAPCMRLEQAGYMLYSHASIHLKSCMSHRLS